MLDNFTGEILKDGDIVIDDHGSPQLTTRELVKEEPTVMTLIEALGQAGLFAKETDNIPDVCKYDDNVYDELYYREKHGETFPDSWYVVMAEVSKRKFEDMRFHARIYEKISERFCGKESEYTDHDKDGLLLQEIEPQPTEEDGGT